MRLLVFAIVLGLVAWLVTFLPIPEPFRTVIWIVLLLVLIWEVLAFFGYTSSPWRYGP